MENYTNSFYNREPPEVEQRMGEDADPDIHPPEVLPETEGAAHEAGG